MRVYSRNPMYNVYILGTYVYRNQTGDEPQKQDTQANNRTHTRTYVHSICNISSSCNNFKRGAPVDRSSSRDTAVACCCCCDGADAARSSHPSSRCRRVPPQGAAGSTSRRDEGRDDETTI